MKATSLEQSKKLLELGIKPETADLWYITVRPVKVLTLDGVPRLSFPEAASWTYLSFYPRKDATIGHVSFEDSPAWSLSALLDMMPSNINDCYLEMDKTPYGTYMLSYCNNAEDDEHYVLLHLTEEYKNLIDAAVDMIKWLLENKYINNKVTEL